MKEPPVVVSFYNWRSFFSLSIFGGIVQLQLGGLFFDGKEAFTHPGIFTYIVKKEGDVLCLFM